MSKLKLMLIVGFIIIFAWCNIDKNRFLPPYKANREIFVPDKDLQGDSTLIDLENLLGLKHLRENCDSFCLRIWYDLTDTSKIFTLKFSPKSFECELIMYGYHENQKKTFLDIYSVEYSLSPKSGWKKFMDTLRIFNVLENPGDRSIKTKYVFVDGGDTYYFQVVHEKEFRIYKYQSPQSYSNSHQGAKDALNVLKFFKSEFGIHPNTINGW